MVVGLSLLENCFPSVRFRSPFDLQEKVPGYPSPEEGERRKVRVL